MTLYNGPIIPSGSMAHKQAKSVLYARLAYDWRNIAAMRAHRVPASFDQKLVDEANAWADHYDTLKTSVLAAYRDDNAPCYMIIPD